MRLITDFKYSLRWEGVVNGDGPRVGVGTKGLGNNPFSLALFAKA